ncbi:MAG TPA: SRPBCC family protein [Solirubrobacteraceae bacterium]|nr:SRPBCC family protein [Solirubrobacteraceae bacterium]
MPTARRTRTVAAAPQRVWELVADPHHFPRWWPGVTRMEGVDGDRWTQVFMTQKGRPVRLDFRLLDSEAPDADAGERLGLRRWEQELTGSPFERVLGQAITEVRVEPAEAGTRVTIEQRQKLRGYSRFVGLMLRRASRKRLDEALDGLEHACG